MPPELSLLLSGTGKLLQFPPLPLSPAKSHQLLRRSGGRAQLLLLGWLQPAASSQSGSERMLPMSNAALE